jgi:hypothetical protein
VTDIPHSFANDGFAIPLACFRLPAASHHHDVHERKRHAMTNLPVSPESSFAVNRNLAV